MIRFCIVRILFIVFIFWNSVALAQTSLFVLGWNVESGGTDPKWIAKKMVEIGQIDVWGLTEVNPADIWTYKSGAEAAAGNDSFYRFILSQTGSDDRMAVIYNANRFDCLWNAELVGYNYALGSKKLRCPLVVHLREKQTQYEFLFMVNHLARGDWGKRHEQARRLNRWAKSQRLPIIATGDYNFDWHVYNGDREHDLGYDLLTENAVFTWIRPETLLRTQCSPNVYGTGCKNNSILDFIFVSGDAKKWAGISEILFPDESYFPDNNKSSDHRPVRAKFTLAEHPGEVVLFNDLGSVEDIVSHKVRIAQVSLKNFGDTKASDEARLLFIADRIAEQAINGICVVDELQDIDGSAFSKLHDAVNNHSESWINFKTGDRVGEEKQEQYGFFWNPELTNPVGSIFTFSNDTIERDPAVATFNCTGPGDTFDFTLVAFHLKPDSNKTELKKELKVLDDIIRTIQEEDPLENDIILIGDFNAPPEDRNGQSISIKENLNTIGDEVTFAIHEPTNFKGDKIYDNIFFLTTETDEFIQDSGKIIQLKNMEDYYNGTIPDERDFEEWFPKNVMDHCPVYAEFYSNKDTD